MKRVLPFGAALALVCAPLLLLHPVRVQGRSMEPTLKDGELRWALRAWAAGPPTRGQVWLVAGPQGRALKRVVGLPGERLQEKEGELWISARVLAEPYVRHGDRESAGPWDLGTGYFLMGDNRPASQDSRTWGPLVREVFEGRVLGVD